MDGETLQILDGKPVDHSLRESASPVSKTIRRLRATCRPGNTNPSNNMPLTPKGSEPPTNDKVTTPLIPEVIPPQNPSQNPHGEPCLLLLVMPDADAACLMPADMPAA